MEPQALLLRDHLLKAASHNLWDEAVRCLFDHADLIDRELFNEATLLSSQRNNTKASAQQGLITRDKERVELAVNDKAFLALFDDIDPDLPVLDGEEVRFDHFQIEISVATLQTKLARYLSSFGVLPALDLLLEIVRDRGPVHALKHNFKTQQWEFSFQSDADLLSWYDTEAQFRKQLTAYIEALDEPQLRKGWERIVNAWTVQAHPIARTGYHLLFPAAEDIYPLIKSDHSPADAGKYRRLLHLAQDAYKLRDYELSLKYCRQVQQYIEPASAQLYEFLLQAFFKQQSANAIIEDALTGNSTLLQQLFVYVSRIKSLLPQAASSTDRSSTAKTLYTQPALARQKLAHIVDALSQSLQAYGARIDFDYVLNNERTTVYLERKNQLERYLQVGVQICRYVEAKPTLVEILVNELAGGGKIDWISTNEDHQLIDNYDFPAVGTFQSLVKQSAKPEGADIQQLFAANLRNSLKQKLNVLYRNHPQLKDSLPLDQEATIFQIVRKWLHACKVAYLLFECDKSFLELAIQDELTRVDGLLDWFTFDAEGQLTERQLQGKYMTSNVKDEYAFILANYYGEQGWKTLESQLIQKYYHRWLQRTAQQYAQLAEAVPKTRDREELRPLVADCIRRWVIAFYVSGDTTLVDKAIEELIGSGIFRWFELLDDGEKGRLEAITTNSLDPDQLLQELVELTDNYDLELAVKETVQHLYYKHIRYAYERIEPNSLVADRQREEVLNAIQQALYCFDLYPNQEFLQLPYVELVQERKFRWLQLSSEGLRADIASEDLGVDPLGLLEKLFLHGQTVGRKYQWEAMTLAIAENRYRDLKARYEDEFHFLRRKNWQLHSRVPMVEILQACILLYRQTGKYRYLEIPDLEWVQNRGKIRWRFDLFPGLYLQHWQNHEISGFNYQRLKREVEQYLASKPLDMRPVVVGSKWPF
jgi:hypothetical protein